MGRRRQDHDPKCGALPEHLAHCRGDGRWFCPLIRAAEQDGLVSGGLPDGPADLSGLVATWHSYLWRSDLDIGSDRDGAQESETVLSGLDSYAVHCTQLNNFLRVYV